MGGRQRGTETICLATEPPLAPTRKDTRGRRGDAPAPKDMQVPLSRILGPGLSLDVYYPQQYLSRRRCILTRIGTVMEIHITNIPLRELE